MTVELAFTGTYEEQTLRLQAEVRERLRTLETERDELIGRLRILAEEEMAYEMILNRIRSSSVVPHD